MEFSDKELAHLVRLAFEGKKDDLALLVRRLARKVREKSPETANALLRMAKQSPSHSSTARGRSAAPLPVDLESRLELARVETDIHLKTDPIWTTGIEKALRQIIAERANEEALARADLHPARSLLFVGPPGVGKTLSARWLASQLGVPLVTLDLAAVMSSFLGRTGNNLRNILDYAKRTGCVFLLDEFDAIAKRRDDAVEVGELKRLVTVLLQEIDNWPASGILIAATNHPELLDPAVWRRFDVVVNYELPPDEHVGKFISQLLGQNEGDLAAVLSVVMQGRSYSDIEREVLRAKRQAILNKTSLLSVLDEFIKDTLLDRKGSDRKTVAVKLVKLGYSQRRAHELTGVSRDTLRKEFTGDELETDDEEG